MKFNNPYFPGADPFLFFFNDTYYLYCTTESIDKNRKDNIVDTTFTSDDGIMVFTSKDLITFECKGLCLNKKDIMGEKWFWAPEVTYYKGKFYMVYSSEEHPAIAVSDSPLGPFKMENKKWLREDKSIDGHLFIDDDGTVYLYYVRLHNGNKIYVAKMKDDLSAIEEEYDQLLIEASEDWETKDCEVAEGPFMLKHKGIYYLVYSANHTRSPFYAVGYATSTSPLGPFKKYSGNPILAQNEHLKGVGHNAFCLAKDGKTLICSYHCHNTTGENFYPRLVCFDEAKFVEVKNDIDKLVIR